MGDQNKEAANFVSLSEDDDKEFFRSIPDGYRFLPKDEELVVHYLKKEVDKEPLPRNKIRRIDIYNHSPQQLCQRDEEQREKEWYFFSRRDRKYPNGIRPTRRAAGGFWKPTGADTAVIHEGSVVGYKKSLDFYAGQHQRNPKRTDWKMHEYRILHHPQPVTKTKDAAAPNNKELDTVLCKIYRKTNAKREDNNDIDDEAGVHQAAANDGADDHQNSRRHFNNEQQQPPQQQLQRVAEPSYNSGGGARVQSIVMDIPTLSTTDSFGIHENGGQEDVTLMNSVEGAGEDYYYYPPFRSVCSFQGFDELSVVVDKARGLRHGADKKT